MCAAKKEEARSKKLEVRSKKLEVRWKKICELWEYCRNGLSKKQECIAAAFMQRIKDTEIILALAARFQKEEGMEMSF